MDPLNDAGLWKMFWGVMPVLLPILLAVAAWTMWVEYVRNTYISGLKWTMLEIKPPAIVDRSPEAMEMILGALYQTGGTGTWLDAFWNGKVRTWFSLEIVSIEGNVYFFVRMEKRFKEYFTSQVYAFYPDAEVREVDDYTRYVPPFAKDTTDWNLSGSEWAEMSKAELYPIKTYRDYELEKQVGMEDHQKIDPLASIIEFMAALGPGEQLWTQILIRAVTHRPIKGEKYKHQEWKKGAEDEIWKYEADFTKKLKEKYKDGKFEDRAIKYMSKQESMVHDALQRALYKPSFDCGIRAMYIAQKDKFRSPISSYVGSIWRLFASDQLNSFKSSGGTGGGDYPWQDFMGKNSAEKKEKFFKAFIGRQFFYPAPKKQMVLNVEELATIFHLPGREVSTPTFSRVEAKKAEPPANLPIG